MATRPRTTRTRAALVVVSRAQFNPWHRLSNGLALELPLGALAAVEHELRQFVVSEVRRPVGLVRRQPEGIALGAMSDEGGLLGAHSR